MCRKGVPEGMGARVSREQPFGNTLNDKLIYHPLDR